MKNMKGKLLALCLTVIMVVAMLAPMTVSAASATTFEIEATHANLAEESFMVPVSVSRNAGFNVGSLVVSYDDIAFEYEGVEEGELGLDVIDSNEEPGTIGLEIEYPSVTGDCTANGVVCYLVFSFTDDAEAIEYEIGLAEGDFGFANIAEETIDVNAYEGYVDVHEGVYWEVETPATYTEAGVERAYCEGCDEPLSLTRPINMLSSGTFALADTSVTCSDTVDTVDVALSVSDNPGFYAAKFAIEVDGLTLTDVTAADGVEAILGQYLVLTSASFGNVTADGTLATLTFAIDDTTVTADYDIAITVVDAADWDELSIAPLAEGATVSVTGFVPQSDYPKFVTTSGGTRYYLDETTYVKGAWQTVDGYDYYFKKSDGYMLTGVTSVSNIYYDFGNDGKCQGTYTGLLTSGGVTKLITDGVAATSSWYTDENGNTYYFKKDGSMAKGDQKIGDAYYTFDSTTGIMQERNGLYTDPDGVRYYVDNAYAYGWRGIGGKTYYFSKSTGLMLTGLTSVDNIYYYFDEDDGHLLNPGESLKVEPDGIRAYNADGTYKTGWWEIDGNTYYFAPKTGYAVTGSKTINNASVTFGSNGVLNGVIARDQMIADGVTGFKIAGKKCSGWISLNGDRYYQSSTLGLIRESKSIGGVPYTIASDGKVSDPKGWVEDETGKKYYRNGEYLVGWQNIDGMRYYFAKATGYLITDARKTINYVLYDINPDDGTLIGQVEGFETDENGMMFYVAGKPLASKWLTRNGQKYYFPSSTYAFTGVQTIGKLCYVFGDDGVLVGFYSGFRTANGVTRYYVDGVALERWQEIDGDWYYFANGTGDMTTGTKKISNANVTFGSDGKLQGTLEFVETANGTQIKAGGAVMYTWIYIGDDTYYALSSTKCIVKDKVQSIGGVNYLFDADGKCLGEVVE